MSARGKLDYDKLLALVGQGLSPTAIANKLGCSRQWVHRWSRDRGLKIGGSKPGRPRTDQGRIVCLKLKVPLAVKRWANQNLDKVQSLVIRAYKNPTSGDIWEDVYDLQHSNSSCRTPSRKPWPPVPLDAEDQKGREEAQEGQ